MAVHPPNPKYIPKPYEQMVYLGQRIQVDMKFVSFTCLKNSSVIGKQFFQYTAMDKYSRWRFVEPLRNTLRISAQFVDHLVKAFLCSIKCIRRIMVWNSPIALPHIEKSPPVSETSGSTRYTP